MKYLVIVFFAFLALAYANPDPNGIVGAPIAVGGLIAPAALGVGVAPGLVGGLGVHGLGLGVGLGHGVIVG